MSQIIVMAKAPVSGRVKTRLCPPCTPDQAASIASAALQDTLDAVRRTSVRHRILALSGDLDVPDEFAVIAQRGQGLGNRLANAFIDCCGAPSLLIGMDTPQVSEQILDDALSQLSQNDAVIGPAYDGGWWGLGLHDASHAEVLRDIPTSTSRTGAMTMAALRRRGVRIAVLPPLRDVDTIVDARVVARDAPDTRFASELQSTVAR